MAEVEHVAAARAESLRGPCRPRAARPQASQTAHPDRDCPAARPCAPMRCARAADVDGPIQADGSPHRSAARLSSHRPPPLVKTMRGIDLTVVGAVQTVRTRCSQIRQRELVKGRVRQRTAPRVEQHHGLCAAFDLRVQDKRSPPCALSSSMRCSRSGRAVQHAFDLDEILAAAAFDHVARQRERAAGESDQRHFVVQRAPDLATASST